MGDGEWEVRDGRGRRGEFVQQGDRVVETGDRTVGDAAGAAMAQKAILGEDQIGLAGHPILFQRAPAGLAEALKQGIGHILQRQGTVEIVKNFPLGAQGGSPANSGRA